MTKHHAKIDCGVVGVVYGVLRVRGKMRDFDVFSCVRTIFTSTEVYRALSVLEYSGLIVSDSYFNYVTPLGK